MYEYDETNGLTKIGVVCNEPLTDATILTIKDKEYLLSTKTPAQNGKILTVYDFNSEKMGVAGINQVIVFDSCIARNAGEVFELNGQYYRPAQDCNGGYGRGVIIQRLNLDKDGKFSFDYVNSFYPQTFKYSQGLHTFNHYKEIGVIDVRGARNPIMAYTIRTLQRWLKFYNA